MTIPTLENIKSGKYKTNKKIIYLYDLIKLGQEYQKQLKRFLFDQNNNQLFHAAERKLAEYKRYQRDIGNNSFLLNIPTIIEQSYNSLTVEFEIDPNEYEIVEYTKIEKKADCECASYFEICVLCDKEIEHKEACFLDFHKEEFKDLEFHKCQNHSTKQ